MALIPPQPIKKLQGDPRWTLMFPLASYAPAIVLTLLVLCIIQICLGAVWISKMGGALQFALVLQPLVLPCLSLFNTVPSAQLHLWTRTNNPKLAFFFCLPLALCYLASALLDIIACAGSGPRSLCPRSTNNPPTTGPLISQTFWNANVGLWLVSFVGYALLTWFSWVVWRKFSELEGEVMEEGRAGSIDPATGRTIRTRGIGEGRRVRDWEEEMLSEEERAKRLKEAEEKWKKVTNL